MRKKKSGGGALGFAPSGLCVVCGQPTFSVSLKCLPCGQKAYLKDELVFAGEHLRAHPEATLELAHDPHKILHLVLLRTAQVAWCGTKVTQQRSKRKRTPATELPPGLCRSCFAAYVEVCP